MHWDMSNFFDEAFARSPDDAGHFPSSTRPRRRKTIGQRFFFWGANLFLMPIVCLIYLSVGAEGLRLLMSIFQMRLYRLPVPGAELLRDYQGWSRLDLAHLMALVLCIAVTLLWIEVFKRLQVGHLGDKHERNPILFWFTAAIAAIILFGDAAIFYVGLASQASSSWSETPAYVAPAATILYMAGLALIGAWHADYSHSTET